MRSLLCGSPRKEDYEDDYGNGGDENRKRRTTGRGRLQRFSSPPKASHPSIAPVEFGGLTAAAADTTPVTVTRTGGIAGGAVTGAKRMSLPLGSGVKNERRASIRKGSIGTPQGFSHQGHIGLGGELVAPSVNIDAHAYLTCCSEMLFLGYRLPVVSKPTHLACSGTSRNGKRRSKQP